MRPAVLFLQPEKGEMRIYDRVITGLAALGALSLLYITCAIVIDVILRNTGSAPFQSTSAVSEYILMFSTMCAAPWLVREQGHVTVSAFTGQLPPHLRRGVGLLVQAVSVVTLALLGWRAGALALQKFQAGTVDMRSISIPSWVLFAMLCFGLTLSAIEFLRQLLRGQVYNGDAGGA